MTQTRNTHMCVIYGLINKNAALIRMNSNFNFKRLILEAAELLYYTDGERGIGI